MIDVKVEVLPVNEQTLDTYSRVPISFDVSTVLQIENIENGLGGMVFREVTRKEPYRQDFDSEERPQTWLEMFDTGNWVIIQAYVAEEPIGGAIIAQRTKGVHMLNGRDDLAVLWDIRVKPEYRDKGIGTRLFGEAVAWARDKKHTQLKVETQNTNVRACRFYEKQGCKLGIVNRYAYYGEPLHEDEIQLIWYLEIG